MTVSGGLMRGGTYMRGPYTWSNTSVTEKVGSSAYRQGNTVFLFQEKTGRCFLPNGSTNSQNKPVFGPGTWTNNKKFCLSNKKGWFLLSKRVLYFKEGMFSLKKRDIFPT